MWIYIFVFVISMIFSEIAVLENKRNKILFGGFSILSFMPVFLISAFRYNVGTDFKNYEVYFYYVKNGSQLEGIERGYWVLTKISSLISENSSSFFFLSSLVVCGVVFLAIYQQSFNPPLSIFLFFGTTMYFVSFNGIRQIMASAVLIYSVKFIQKENIFKFFLFIIIATLFHSSAILFLPVYFVAKIKINLKRTIMLILAVVVSIPIFDRILIFASSILGYSQYFNSKFNTGEFEIWFFLINLGVLLLFSLFSNWRDINFQKYYWIQLISFITTTLSSFIPLANRITWYFMFVQIISVPFVLKQIRNKKTKSIVTLCVCVAYFMVAYIGIGIQGSHNAVPYRWIFT